MSVATVNALFRYPVKSMLGETLDGVTLAARGIPGDRCWAVRDEVRGGIRGAKKIPELMRFAASFDESVPESGSAHVTIRFPDGNACSTRDTDAAARLSAALSHEVTLWPLLPAEQLEHYRRGAPDKPDMEAELRDIFGRTGDEPLPDLSVFPPEIMEYESPPGTYFDAFPLLLLSRQSLDTMQARHSQARFDQRRFRPNLLIEDTDPEHSFPEGEWVGRRLAVGEAILRVEILCPRCAMVTHGFADLPRDPSIMRALVRDSGGNLGVYASVEKPGAVAPGDALRLLD